MPLQTAGKWFGGGIAAMFVVVAGPVSCTQGVYDTATEDNYFDEPATERFMRHWGKNIRQNTCYFVEGVAGHEFEICEPDY